MRRRADAALAFVAVTMLGGRNPFALARHATRNPPAVARIAGAKPKIALDKSTSRLLRRLMKDQYRTISEQYSQARTDDVTHFLETPSVQSALGDISGARAIDYACGTGHFSRLLKKLGATYVLGVDLSPAMIEAAQQAESEHPLGIVYEISDAATMAIFGSFDVATAVFLFNYAEDEQALARMLSSVAANLTEDGRLIAVVPNSDFINGRDDMLPNGYFLEEIGKGPERLRCTDEFRRR